MERRKFIGLFGVGMFASSLPMILAACSSNSTTTQTETPAPTAPTENSATEGMSNQAENNSAIDKAENTAEMLEDYTVVGTIAALNDSGDLSTEVNGKKVYVFRNPTDQTIVALEPTCNHKGCPVKVTEKNLACTCHGSRFAFDGTLTEGPATASLPRYEVKEQGENILVKVV